MPSQPALEVVRPPEPAQSIPRTELKPVEKPIGLGEQGIIARIDKDGPPDQVFQDISQLKTEALSWCLL